MVLQIKCRYLLQRIQARWSDGIFGGNSGREELSVLLFWRFTAAVVKIVACG